MSESPRSDRTLWVVVGIVGALVVIALAVVLTRPTAESLDPDSPDGVVQRYSAAYLDGDSATALEYLTSETRANCEPFPFVSAPDTRVLRDMTVVTGDRATVAVTISQGDRGLFGGSYEYEERFELEREGGEWRIRTAPWAFHLCEGVRR